jgi:multidrug efflux pump subunit AcrB
MYTPLAAWALEHRKLVLVLSLIPLGLAFSSGRFLKRIFFPKDLSYLSYVDVWLAEDAPLWATREIAFRVEETIRKTAAKYAEEEGRPESEVLEQLTTYIGGGGPRFWFSIIPEQEQLNYAQVIIQVKDKHDTSRRSKPPCPKYQGRTSTCANWRAESPSDGRSRSGSRAPTSPS